MADRRTCLLHAAPTLTTQASTPTSIATARWCTATHTRMSSTSTMTTLVHTATNTSMDTTMATTRTTITTTARVTGTDTRTVWWTAQSCVRGTECAPWRSASVFSV